MTTHPPVLTDSEPAAVAPDATPVAVTASQETAEINFLARHQVHDVRRSPWPWAVLQRITALAACLIILPLFVFLFVIVKLSSPGPFLFRQRRRGFAGKPFEILKIRTMAVGSEARTALGVQNTDPSLTRTGRVLRALKVDELPQLWNIVRGEMELVGPRPIPMPLENKLAEKIPGFRERYRVKPGLTNMGQVSVIDNELDENLIRDWTLRSEAERHYILHKSFAYDVILVVLTLIYIVRKAWRLRSPADARPATTHVSATHVLGIPIANLDYDGVLDQVARWLRSEKPHHYVCICPVHSLVHAKRDPRHLDALLQSSLNTADGVPVVWAQRVFGYPKATRVYGPTLMLTALRRAEQEGWRVALYGSHPQRLPKLLSKLRYQFPRLAIVFADAPPFRPLTPQEDEEVVRRLNAAKPDLVWVGLGCPKQERWMAEHCHRIPAVFFGVGAAFDFHAGAVRQAPGWLQRCGLEWFYRLSREPRRLWKRYATTNPTYIALFLKQWMAYRLRGRRYQSRLPLETEPAARPAAPPASGPAAVKSVER